MAEAYLIRTQWIDATKGIMIVLVVFGHAWRGLNSSGIIPEALFSAVDGRIYAFHMPVFFSLAAWFFFSSLDRLSIEVFALQRLVRLLWPIVLWTYIFLGAKVLAGSMANKPVQLSEFFIVPVPGVIHLWFLWALLILNFAFLTLKPFIHNGVASLLVLSVVGFVVVALQFTSLSPDTVKWVAPAIHNAPFFFLGLVIAQYGQKMEVTPCMRVFAIGLFLVIITFWPILLNSGFVLIYKLTLTLCVLIIFLNFKFTFMFNLRELLCRLGSASMVIYLAHTIFSAFLRELFFTFEIDNLAIHLVLGTLIGLVGPLILLHIALRTNTSRLLGL